MKMNLGHTAPSLYCSLCREGIGTGGKLLHPPYSIVNQHLYLTAGDFICRDCLNQLGLICFNYNDYDITFNTTYDTNITRKVRELLTFVSTLPHKTAPYKTAPHETRPPT